jgi:CDP-2,3-bis-(O-geranylgeranyl)-sn-glycerol synthase
VLILWPLVQALYLFSPLLLSVALSAVVHRYDLFPSWKLPIDGGHTLGGKRVFGDSKTWRGVAVAVIGSVAMVLVQKYVFIDVAANVVVIDYARVNPIIFGGTMGLLAMIGELPNSFVKRRLGIEPGAVARAPALRAIFWTWDQIDLLTLSWPALLVWLRPTLPLILASLALALALHPLVAWVGFVIGARKTAR